MIKNFPLVRNEAIHFNKLSLFFRREKWEKNMDKIEEHNKKFSEGKISYKKGPNEYSDLVRKANMLT